MSDAPSSIDSSSWDDRDSIFSFSSSEQAESLVDTPTTSDSTEKVQRRKPLRSVALTTRRAVLAKLAERHGRMDSDDEAIEISSPTLSTSSAGSSHPSVVPSVPAPKDSPKGGRSRKPPRDLFLRTMQQIMQEDPFLAQETLATVIDQIAARLSDLGMEDRCVAFITSERARMEDNQALRAYFPDAREDAAKRVAGAGRVRGQGEERDIELDADMAGQPASSPE
ncbi:hypothetical protein HKX48_007524 [Thoreauomyces humboldtii]|nr:hypothetical protein HKX48_007524 [Thoreauomyces humboldtii]